MKRSTAFKLVSILLLFPFSLETAVVSPSFLAPGQFVGGFPFQKLKQIQTNEGRRISVELASDDLPTLQSPEPNGKPPRKKSFAYAGLLAFFLGTPFLGPILMTLSGCASPPKTEYTVKPEKSPLEDGVTAVPLKLSQLPPVEYYGWTQGGESKMNGETLELRYKRASADSFGNGVVTIEKEFAQIVKEAGGIENIAGIRFKISKGGWVRAWVRTTEDFQNERYVPYIGDRKLYRADGSFITIGREHVEFAHSKKVNALIFDLMDRNAADISDIQVLVKKKPPQCPDDDVLEIPLGSDNVHFYGDTQAGSKIENGEISLKINEKKEGWGNTEIVIRDKAAKIGVGNLKEFRFKASGGGKIKVWVTTAEDIDAKTYMPTHGGKTYTADGSEIVIGAKILGGIRGKGHNPHAIVIDCVEGKSKITAVKLVVNQLPVEKTPKPRASADVADGFFEKGKKLKEEIEKKEVPAFSKSDPKKFVAWMEGELKKSDRVLIPSAIGESWGAVIPSWIYTSATAMKFLVQQEKVDLAQKVANQVMKLQKSDGSWYSGYDAVTGNPLTKEVSPGNVAWTAMGLLDVYLAIDDKTEKEKIVDSLLKASTYLKSLQQADPSKPRYGSLQGGSDGGEKKIDWTSTEHNLDVASFFCQMGQIDHPKISTLEFLARSRMIFDWIVRPAKPVDGGMWDKTNRRFHTGYKDAEGTLSDYDEPTDAVTWTLLALKAAEGINHPYKAAEFKDSLIWILSRMKEVEYNGKKANGFAVKSNQDIPSVSTELTFGFAQAAGAVGETKLATYFDWQMEALKEEGGFYFFRVGNQLEKARQDLLWQYDFRKPHQTAVHWAYLKEPFALNKKSAKGVKFIAVPKEEELKKEIARLAKQNSGRIGRGLVSAEWVKRGLIEEWRRWKKMFPNSTNRIEREAGIVGPESWVESSFQLIRDRMEQVRARRNLTEKEKQYLNRLETFLEIETRYRMNREIKISSGYRVTPFEGSNLDPENFMMAFAEKEENLINFGFNIPFIRYLLDLPQSRFGVEGRRLVAEVVFHELIHALAELDGDVDHETVHQEARHLQVKFFSDSLPPIVSNIYVQSVLDRQQSPLNRAIRAYLQDSSTSDRLLTEQDTTLPAGIGRGWEPNPGLPAGARLIRPVDLIRPIPFEGAVSEKAGFFILLPPRPDLEGAL